LIIEILYQYKKQEDDVSFSELSKTKNQLQNELADMQLQQRESTQQVAAYQLQLAEQEKQAEEYQAQLHEFENSLVTIREEKRIIYENFNDLQMHLNQREQILQELNTKLLEIYSSRAWKLIKKMWQMRLWLAPKNSWREGFARKILKVRSIEGHQKLNLKPTETDKFTTERINDVDHFITENKIDIEVSIIIPVYNAIEYTKECIASIYSLPQNIPFEVIVINNASVDKTKGFLEKEKNRHPNFAVITLEENLGFGPAVNIGIDQAIGKYIIILNNDTIVSNGWLSRLIAHLETDPSIGIISPVTNYVGEGLQVDKDSENLIPDQTAINNYSQKISNKMDLIYEANRLVFFCVLIKRELIDQIGKLDENYKKGNFEDDDYCLRTRFAGYRLAIAKNSFVFHRGSMTFKINKISHDELMEKNRLKFYKKVGRISTSYRPLTYFNKNREIVLSVIVRTKDRPKLLIKALTSLANQYFRDFEVVLVNDGGICVKDIINEFQNFFPIKYIKHNISHGRTAAINAGLQRAEGRWIGYLDDDDILYPWHFEVLMQSAKENENKTIYSNSNFSLLKSSNSLEPSSLMGIEKWKFDKNEFLIRNRIPIHSYIHLKEYSDKLNNWDESFDRLEDYEFLLRLNLVSDFYHVDKFTCEYRFYLDVSNSISFEGREKYIYALRKIYTMYPVCEDWLKIARQETINAMVKQVDQIKEISKKYKDTEKVQREVIRLVTGL